MAEEAVVQDDYEEEEFVAPASKTIDEIREADKDDPSMQQYKALVLGDAFSEHIVLDENDERKLLLKRMSLVVENRPDVDMDLTEIDKIKSKKFTLKEGVKFRIKIEFMVQREIVAGLKYVQKTSKGPITVDKMKQMVGSFAPNKKPYIFLTEPMDAPSGLLMRHTYNVSSVFIDDDKFEHLKWDWNIEIKSDWE